LTKLGMANHEGRHDARLRDSAEVAGTVRRTP
jgi:hypothetical protein